jgi:hypothetical protein
LNRATFIALTLIALAASPLAVAQQRRESLAQQKMCGDQAKKVFKEEFAGEQELNDRGGMTLNYYVSHYDSRANICYMMTQSTQWIEHQLVRKSYRVTDAFEQHEFAGYGWLKGNAPPICFVASVHPGIHCKTEDEFVTLVDKFFGLSF